MTRIGIIGAGSLGRYHALCWRALGVLSWETGAIDGAIKAYLRALAGARQVGARDFEARVLVSLGNGHLHRGRPERAVQRALGLKGADVDGVYGAGTAQLVREVQARRHLVPDGKVGPATAHALGLGWSSS